MRGVITLLAIYKIPKLKYFFAQYACRPSKSVLSRKFRYTIKDLHFGFAIGHFTICVMGKQD